MLAGVGLDALLGWRRADPLAGFVIVAVMVLLVLDLFPLGYVFMVGSAVALIVNFPRLRDQADEIVAHAPSIVGVVSMVLAAGVLVSLASVNLGDHHRKVLWRAVIVSLVMLAVGVGVGVVPVG